MKRFSDKLTFVVFTYNEEKRIERVIKNFIHSGAVLIVDNHSTDGTVRIAEQHGCKVLLNKNQGWVEDEVTAQRVKDAVQTPWIYWAYADEMLERKTLDHLVETIESDQYSVISMARKNYYYGRFLHDAFIARLTRVFKKEAVDFTGNRIHHFGRVTVASDKVYQMPSDYFVHHFISNTAESYVASLNRYSTIEATASGAPRHIVLKLLRVGVNFVTNYAFRGAWRAGVAGFYVSFFQLFYELLSHMKSLEKARAISSANIESTHDVARDEILRGLQP